MPSVIDCPERLVPPVRKTIGMECCCENKNSPSISSEFKGYTITLGNR